jgi:AcrR family transcriptional regulator
MPRKTGKNDAARERSRAALLQAGADLMVQDALRNPFAALRLRRLCAQAGLSTGAFYVHWANLADYYDDLAHQLTEEDELAFRSDFTSMAGLAQAGDQDSAVDAITRVADTDLELLVSNPLWDAMELVCLTWGRTTDFRHRLARGYQTLDHRTAQIYQSIPALQGREPRPPFTWDSIGTILQGLAEGLGLRHKIDPASVPGSTPSAPGPYATAIAAVLAVLTRSAGDDEDASQAILALLQTPVLP